MVHVAGQSSAHIQMNIDVFIQSKDALWDLLRSWQRNVGNLLYDK
jgi:hypothetical protein